jgi:hypothetical protein
MPQEDSWYLFLLEAVSTKAIVQLEGLGKLKKKSNNFDGIQTYNLPAFSTVPQPTMLPRVPIHILSIISI